MLTNIEYILSLLAFKKSIVVSLIMCLPFIFCKTLEAQNRVVDKSFNTWWTNVNKYDLSDKFFLTSEIHVRRTNGLKYWQQFLFRPGINYKVNQNVSLSVGYTFIQSYPYGEQPLPMQMPENNVWEQVAVSQKIGKVKLNHRYRLEHRFIGNVTTNNADLMVIDGTTYEQRFRYRLTGSFPIAKEGRWFAKWFDEIWINMADNFMPLSMNQNWLYGGIGYKFSERGVLELGYMSQLIRKGDGIHYESNPTLQATIAYHFARAAK